MLFGGYEPNPVARWVDGVPWEHGERTLPADPERFEQLMGGAAGASPSSTTPAWSPSSAIPTR